MTELYLIAPAEAETAAFAAVLPRIFAARPVAALLLPRGGRSNAAYTGFVHEIAFIGQEAGTAVLIEGEPRLAKDLGVDGLHVSGSLAAAKAAIAALKPDFIVGASGIGSRHEAMSLGELGLDYIMFGPFSGAIGPETRELAGWWAETMEIPSVLSDPEAAPATADASGCEFFALSESVWRAPDPVAAVIAIADRLGVGL